MTSSASVHVPRRSVLRTGAGLAVSASLAAAAAQARAVEAGAGPASGPGAPGARRAGPTSANGWPVEDAADDGGAVWTVPVPGSPLSVALRIGDVSAVLVHVVRRYHYEIDTLAAGELTGFRRLSGTLRGHTTDHSTDHASGTAVAVRPGWFPPGARGGLFAHQVNVVRDVLAEAQGVVAWGGDCRVPDESRFHIAVPPADPRLKRLADRVRGWADVPGAGAGTRVVGS
ncbi:hypothetical protein ACIQUQ_05620 [Streptomyces sp. NPDC101118]|uniref:hypothetical protein n=1 Tax=Streptomyces sp. NPDC101118 TaxID=3366109 RepID=UPI0037FFFF4E